MNAAVKQLEARRDALLDEIEYMNILIHAQHLALKRLEQNAASGLYHCRDFRDEDDDA